MQKGRCAEGVGLKRAPPPVMWTLIAHMVEARRNPGVYPPGVGALQDLLCLVSYHFLSQVVEHADTQQDPGEGDGGEGGVLNFGTVCQQWLLAAAAVHPSPCQG